jgi:cell division inhibitor SepF
MAFRDKWDSLKGRVGGGSQQSTTSRRRTGRTDDDYDEFADADYGEYGYDDNADYAQPGYQMSSERKSRTSSTVTPLVTADDVRRSSSVASRYGSGSQGTSEATRSAGYNSLFEPSGDDDAKSTAAASTRASSTANGAYVPRSDRVPDANVSTYNTGAYAAASSRVTPRSARILTVVKPTSYDQAERIAAAVKAGDVAIVAVRDTPTDLARRVLDFGFGVAAATDAHVDSVAEGIFAITRGAELNDDERARLHDQGLL